MIDFAHITVTAGKGGDGSGSRTQIKGKRYGRADGGDGGWGGNVFLEATSDQNTLEPYRFLRHFEAKNGVNGFANLRRGATGEDLVLKVPVGTQVKVEQSIGEALVIDLVEDGQKVLLARGGQGGRGNAHLRDEYGRRPRVGEKGAEGEKFDLTLELKIIADVGLIGLPNAGKSTLLARLSAAKPAIAAYPFTTLEPNLGVFKKASSDGKRKAYSFVIADIPGLIEGASEGRGLGVSFLRHIERTKVLVHLIDVSRGSQLTVDSSQTGQNEKYAASVNRQPITVNSIWEDYQTVKNELKRYSKELTKKKEIIVLNKIDLAEREVVDRIFEEFKSHRKKVFLISAEKGIGLDELTREIFKRLK